MSQSQTRHDASPPRGDTTGSVLSVNEMVEKKGSVPMRIPTRQEAFRQCAAFGAVLAGVEVLGLARMQGVGGPARIRYVELCAVRRGACGVGDLEERSDIMIVQA